MKSKGTTLAALAATAILASTTTVQAAELSFSYSGVNIATSGTLTVSDTATNGFFSVLNISGFRNGVAITGLSTAYNADNLVSLSSPFVTFDGISFAVLGGAAYNFYNAASSGPPNYAEFTIQPGVTTPTALNSLTVIPEPAPLGFVAGLAILGVVLRRKAKAA